MSQTIILDAVRLQRVRSFCSRHALALFGYLAALFFVGLPLAWLAIFSITSDSAAGFTLGNYAEVFTNEIYLKPVWYSIRLGVSTTVLALALGVPLAWVVSYTDVPGRRVLRVLVYASFILPAFIAAVAWTYLAAPTNGPFNSVINMVVGKTPIDPYNLNFLAVVMAFSLYPYIFAFSTGAFDAIGDDLEEAAAISGARSFHRVRTIIVPMALPAILGSALLVFLQAISEYGGPALITTPAGKLVVSTQMYTFFQAFPSQVHLAAAFAFPIVAVTIVLLVARRRILGRRGYISVGGKSSMSAGRMRKLGRSRWPVAAASWGIVLCASALPLGALLFLSLVKSRNDDHLTLTVEHYQWVFSNALGALAHTAIFSGVAAIVCTGVGFCAAYLRQRSSGPGSRWLEGLATLPIAIPGIILSVGIYAAFSGSPLPLTGTPVVLVIAYVGRFLPVTLQALGPSVQSLHRELEEASRIAGFGQLGTLMRVTLPIVKPSLAIAGVLAFVLSTQELSASVLLVSVDTSVVSTTIASQYAEGQFERIGALAVTAVVGTSLVLAAALRFLGPNRKRSVNA